MLLIGNGGQLQPPDQGQAKQGDQSHPDDPGGKRTLFPGPADSRGDEPAAEQETQGDGKAHRHIAEFRRADTADGPETGREKADGRQGLQEDDGRQPAPRQVSQQDSQHPGGSEKKSQ